MVELRESSGVLFRNYRKQKENQPDYTGSCKIGGTIYYLSAWIREANGQKFFSMSFQIRVTDDKNIPISCPKEEE